jgi:integrase
MRVFSEGPVRITRATIEAAWRRRKSDNRLIVRDLEARGLALIVNATSMTWSYSYRPRGVDPLTKQRFPNRTVTLGNPASHSPEDARVAASRIKGQVVAGGDPVTDRKAKEAADRRKGAITLGRLLDTYAKALPRRPKQRGAGLPAPSYVAVEIAQTRFAIASINAEEMPVSAFTAAEVRRVLDSEDGGSARARFGALSRFLDWCQDNGHTEANPCALIARSRRPKAPRARSNYLTPTDLARLWTAAGSLSEPVWRDFARFLIAVPCRRGEATRMEWPHVDLGAAEWRQPGHMTKNRDPHRLHLHSLALDVLRTRREATGEKGLVFPAPVSGKLLDNLSRLTTKVSVRADLTGWTWHDFRRSFATALGEAGISEAVADAILNHRQSATRGGVLGVYQRASRWPEQVKAMEHWGHLLAAAINPSDVGSNVVSMTALAG